MNNFFILTFTPEEWITIGEKLGYLVLGILIAAIINVILIISNNKAEFKRQKEQLIRKELQELFQKYYDLSKQCTYKVRPTIENCISCRQEYFDVYITLKLENIKLKIYFDHIDHIDNITKKYHDNYKLSQQKENNLKTSFTPEELNKFHENFIKYQARTLKSNCIEAMNIIQIKMNKLTK